MAVCNIENCEQEEEEGWLSDKIFMIYACTKHFKKYHFTNENEIPLKPEVMVYHVRGCNE